MKAGNGEFHRFFGFFFFLVGLQPRQLAIWTSLLDLIDLDPQDLLIHHA